MSCLCHSRRRGITTIRTIPVVTALSVVAIGIGFFAVSNNSREIVIRRTDFGFVPRTVVIARNDTVVFVNEAKSEMWPASDAHPTHGLYAQFDPKDPIPAGEKWRFRFTRAGDWSYHDHLMPEMRGSIIVSGSSGKTAKECLSRISSSTRPIYCYEAEIVDVIRKGGVDLAFEKFKGFFADNPAFRKDCHDVTHTLGAAAYRAYKADNSMVRRAEATYCGFGFYHGFIEAMLLEEGNGAFETARAYCSALQIDSKPDNFSGACLHGIGHAVFDSLPGALWGDEKRMVDTAIAICENELSDERGKVKCSTGVYNSLAIAESSRTYSLAFDGPSSIDICREQKELYQVGCFIEVGVHLIDNMRLSRQEAIDFIRSFPAASRIPTFEGYLSSQIQKASANLSLQEYADQCGAFVENEWREACYRAVVTGLLISGHPGTEHESVFRFCSLFKAGSTQKCLLFALPQLRQLAGTTTEFHRWCSKIEDKEIRQKCLARR